MDDMDDVDEFILQGLTAENPLMWTRRNYAALDAAFFDALEAWRQGARAQWDEQTARQLDDAAQMIEKIVGLLDNPDLGQIVLKGLENVETHADLVTWLGRAMPLITQDFFVALGEWADESTRNSDTAIYIYETLLDEMQFNDLRDDWDEPEQSIIWGAAWFMNRHHSFVASVDIFGDEHPLDYQKVSEFLSLIHFSYPRNDMLSTALAMCNLFLSACPRVVEQPSMISREDEMRLATLVAGANLIRARAITTGIEGLANVQRLLDEATAVSDRLKHKSMSADLRAAIEKDVIALTELAGTLALDTNNYEEAIRLLNQAFEQAGHISLLSPLAMAELRLWRLDDACVHYDQLVAYQREIISASSQLPDYVAKLGKDSQQLADFLRWHARAEFLRTNFERAEELLDEAARVEQEISL